MTASNFSSVFNIIHMRHCTPRERLCWGVSLGLRHVSLPLHTETRAQPEGQLPAGPQPISRLAPPAWHHSLMLSKWGALQAPSSRGSHNMVDDIYHALLPAILLCHFFSSFLYLLPKLHFLLTISLSLSLSPAAEFLLRLGQSHPNTLA